MKLSDYLVLGACNLGSVAQVASFTATIGALGAELSAPAAEPSRVELLELRRTLDGFAAITTNLRAAVLERVRAIDGGSHYAS